MRVQHLIRLVLVVLVAALVPMLLAQQPPAEHSAPNRTASIAPESQSAEMPQELVVGGKPAGKLVPSKPGEICRLCNHPIEPGDAVYQVRGQRVAVHRQELSQLPARLAQILAQLEPRGAFLGAGAEQPALSSGWFLAGLYILVGLVFAALCAHRALHAGHNPIVWFLIGLALNLLAYLWLLTRPRREVYAPAGVPRGLRKIASTYQPQPCPECGATNHPAADQCVGCGARLEPSMVSEAARVRARAS